MAAVAPSASISSKRSDSVEGSTLASASPSAQFAVAITANEQSRAVASYRSCAKAPGDAATAARSNATAVAPRSDARHGSSRLG